MKKSSSKTKITITLETDIYLRVKMSDINASALVNDFFKGYFNIKEEDLLEHEILLRQAEEKQRESALLISKAEQMKKKSEEKDKEEVDKAERMNQGLKSARWMDGE